jgi:hypothetical protein
MSGLIVLLLAVAIPLGIVVLAVIATESERKAHQSAPANRFMSAIVFGIAALIGVLLVFRGTGTEYAPAIAFVLGIPAIVIAALLAVAGHRLVVGRSKVIAALSGASIALLTAVGTSSAFAAFFAPDQNAALFAASFGAAIVLLPQGVPILLIGASAGVLLSHLSNRKRPTMPPNPDVPKTGTPVG